MGAGISVHTLSLLLASRVAHDRAKVDTQKGTPVHQYNKRTLNVGTVHKPRQGGVNSVPL